MTPAQRAQRGMTLVELMVAVAIGLFLVAVMGAIYIGSKGAFTAQNALARLQENGRFAVDTISSDLRMAGYRGCRGSGRTTPLANTLNSATSVLYDYGQPIVVSRHTGSAWTPALDPAIATLSPAPSVAGDVVTVRRVVGAGWSLIADMANGTSSLSITPTDQFAQGDVLLLSDCAGAAVLMATNAFPGSAGRIEHDAGTAPVPGLATNDLGRPYLQDAVVHRLASVTYYLAPSARPGKSGVNSLWSHSHPSYDGTPQPVELVSGVQAFAMTLGLDTDGDSNADKHLTPDAVVDWSQVVSARVEMLLVGAESNTATSAQTYTFGGSVVTSADRRLRTVMAVTVSLRNSLP
jgi:type IV pilus assembly protein PilW